MLSFSSFLKCNYAFAILLIIVLGWLPGCSSDNTVPDGGIIHIDVLEAFKEERSMKLSDFVKDVEFIQFEASKDSYFMNARSCTVGDKYIMIADDGEDRIILFDRQGNFIRHIGNKGKGPGEYNTPWHAAMDPSERFIIVADGIINKILKYSIEGEFLKSIDSKDIALGRFMDEVRFINENQFVVINRRPIRPADGYSSLPLFDLELNLIKKILPRENDDNLCLSTNPNGVFGLSEDRMTFWEPYIDTLYTITDEGDAIPTHVIGFSKGGPSKEYATTPTYGRDPQLSPKNMIFSINEFGGYMQIGGISNNDRFRAVIHKKSGEMFRLTTVAECDSSGNFKTPGLENDLYGISPVYLREYSRNIDRIIAWARPEWIGRSYDLDCIKKKKVKYPELRDRFIEIAEDPEASSQMLLVLMKLK